MGQRYVFVAEFEGNVAGYTTMLKSATSGPIRSWRIYKDRKIHSCIIWMKIFINYL